MFCKNCGKEIQDGWKTCPFCGSEIVRKASAETEKAEERTEAAKVYELRGIRRGGNFIQREIQTRVEIDGGEVSVCTGRKSKDKKFKITDIVKAQCSYGPVWWVSDFVRIVIFALLMLLSYGMAAFAVILSLYIACSNQLILVLKDGTKVKIPVCQKGETVELLEGLGAYEEANKYKGKLVSETSWNVKYFLVSIALFALAVSTLYLGMNMMMDKVKEMEARENRDERQEQQERSTESEAEIITLKLELVNQTGVDIYSFYASQPDSESWEEDIFGENILYDGESGIVTFEFWSDELVWDFAMADSEGNIIEFYGMDFSGYSKEGMTLVLEYDGEQGYATLTNTEDTVIANEENEIDYQQAYLSIINEIYTAYDEYCKYALYDIDGDGIKEMIASYGTCLADWWNTVYTIENGNVIVIGEFGGESVLYEAEDGNGLYSVYGIQGWEEISQLTKSGSQLNISIVKEGEIGENDYYSNPYPVETVSVSDSSLLTR